jgi:hypothetical protein
MPRRPVVQEVRTRLLARKRQAAKPRNVGTSLRSFELRMDAVSHSKFEARILRSWPAARRAAAYPRMGREHEARQA